jgi:hypothetical protein
MNQKDRTAFEVALEARQQPIMNRWHCKREFFLVDAAPNLEECVSSNNNNLLILRGWRVFVPVQFAN